MGNVDISPHEDVADDPVVLGYVSGHQRRAAWLRRRLRPGSPGFFLVVLALAAATAWVGWKQRIRADERAFSARAVVNWTERSVRFDEPPNAASLRYLARLPGMWSVSFQWTDPDPSAPATFPRQRLPNVTRIIFGKMIDSDRWLKELARQDCGLTALDDLVLSNTNVTDKGLEEMSRHGSGLRTITLLAVDRTRIGDPGLKMLARRDSSLTKLTALNLCGTRVTDEGLRDLTRPDSGLKSLLTLYLDDTDVTDAGAKELAQPSSGLKLLTLLSLYHTRVTDAGVKDLSRPDSALNGLRWLDLGVPGLTDFGLKELCRPDSGLKALDTLFLFDTDVNAATVESLKKAHPGICVSYYDSR